jgi:hypothetical protein
MISPVWFLIYMGVAGYGARLDAAVMLATQRVILTKFYLIKWYFFSKYDAYIQLEII